MSRDRLLDDAYASVVQAKKLIAVAQASTPADAPDELTEANRNRLEKVKLHLTDAIRSIDAATEIPT